MFDSADETPLADVLASDYEQRPATSAGDDDSQTPMKTETNVDDDIDQQEAGWEFDDEVAQQFDDHVRRSIPNYNRIQHAVAKLSDWFLKGDGDEYVYDLGCATGETITHLVEHHQFDDDPLFVGIDEQPAMLDRAAEKIPSHARYRLANRDLTVDPSFPNASLIISLFTLSFLDEGDRQRVLDAAYDDLDRGGALIFCEKTRADSAFYQDLWTEHYWDFKSAQGLDDEQILGKARTLRGQLRPLTVDEYLSMLDTAGFNIERDVEVWYKFYPWTGVVARKP